jgi:SAM-dependent methyltransferase
MDRGNFIFRFHHRPKDLAPVKAWTSGTSYDDKLIVDRVITAYQLVSKQFKSNGDSIWQTFFLSLHKDIHQILIDNQREKVTSILRNPASSDLFYGFDNISKSLLSLSGRRLEDLYQPTQTLDNLLRLAEAIGVRRLDNPEAYSYLKKSLRIKTDEVIELLETTFGFQIDVPNPYPKECGVLSMRGVISYRVPQAIYQAWRISQLVAHIPNPRVLEIGAGLGRTAFYARQFGIKDYTIIDIPITSLSQGYFLGRALGNDSVLLFNENAQDAATRIKILPPSFFLNGADHYDLVVNVDSLTEMDETAARAYWQQIKARTDMFLSINRENTSFTVRELISGSTRIICSDRVPYWMRRGYVEETVRFAPKTFHNIKGIETVFRPLPISDEKDKGK